MNLTNSINYLFSEVTNLFWNRLEKSMIESGLHSGQIFILIALWNEDGQIQVDLSKSLNLSPPTINKMVKSLQSNGYVSTRRSKTDGRKVRVFLTDKGSAVRKNVEEQWENLENDFFSPLTETERLILRQIFDKLKEAHLPSVAAD